MQTIFAANRDDYTADLAEDADGNIVVIVNGHAIVLNEEMTRDLVRKVAAWANRQEGWGIEPFTCATAHLAAERTLRIVEHAAWNAKMIDSETIEAISYLADKAGVENARKALGHGPRGIEDTPF